MRIWPGTPYPLGATWDGWGTNFALFSEVAERVELCLFDEADDGSGTLSETRVELTEVDGFVWHGYLPGVAPGPALRLPGARARTTPRAGCAATPPSCCSTRTPRRSTGERRAGTSRCSATTFGDPDEARNDRATAPAARAEVRGHRPVLRLGRRPAAADPLPRDRHLRGARAGLTMRHPDVPGAAARHLRRARPPGGHRPPAARSGVTAVELLPVHQFVARAASWSTAGLTNYWGYNTIGFFAPHSALRRRRPARRAGAASSRRWCKALHAAGHRGDPRRRLQPHRRGQPHWARRCRFRGIDNAAYYRLARRRPALLPGLHRLRQHARTCAHPHVAAADHGLAALLGHRDARRRVPLRPGRRRWPASCTTSTGCRAFFDIIHQDPVLSQVKLIAEPWDVGRGRLPGRQLPAAVDRVERQVPRHRARLLEGRRRHACRSSPPGSPAPATCTQHERPPPVASDQLRHLPRRLHAARPRQLRRQAQRGQRRGQPRRHRRQPLAGTAASRARPTIPTINALRERQKRNFLATLLLSQGVPMLLAGDEMGRTQRGNNNAYCQDNEMSWLDWNLAAAEQRDCWSSPRRWPACAASTRCSAGAGSSAASVPGGGEGRHRLAHPRRARR